MTVFEGCQVALELDSTVRFKKKLELKKKVTDNGGIVSFIVTNKVRELSNLASTRVSFRVPSHVSYRCVL